MRTAPELEQSHTADLVGQAQDGDPGAFEQLYYRHLGLVRGVVVMEGCERSVVEDVVQEVFALVWSRLRALRDPERFRPWLLQITRRKILDQARRSVRLPRLLVHTEALLTLESRAPSPEECAEASDLADRISRVVDTMSGRDVDLLQQAVNRHCGVGTVDDSTGSSTGATKVALHRARVRLAEQLAATG